MAKILEDSVGTFKHVLIFLSCIGILYILAKELKIKIRRVQKNSVEGASSYSHGLRFNTVSDSTTHVGYNN